MPLADSEDREYVYNDKFDRKGYFTELSKCWVGVCGKSYHKGWVNSAADGMSVGTPYIFLNAGYYSECIKDAGIYFNDDDEFMKEMNKMLDDENHRNEYSEKSKEIANENTWKKTIISYNKHFIEAEKKLNVLKDKTDSYKKIFKFIHDKKSVSKSDILEYMGWGIRISFDGYRNLLRKEPTIKFTKNRYEVK